MNQFDFTKIIEALKNIITILGIAIGGLWAYYHFIKGRVFKPRVEGKISGSISQDQEIRYLLATLQIKNVGLSRVILKQQGSALRVFSLKKDTYSPEVSTVEWEKVWIFSVFERHEWIEPGEPIEDQVIIPIPLQRMKPFKLDLRIVAENRVEWNFLKIIT